MNVYAYQASQLNADGKTQSTGKIEAQSEANALMLLQQRGLRVYDLKPVLAASDAVPHAPGLIPSLGGQRVTTTVLASVLFQVSTLLEAGVPLADAVDNAATGQEGHATLHAALRDLHTKLRGGVAFSEALRVSALPWPSHVIELARAGELTGKLGPSLRAAVDQMEQDLAFSREVRNAMIYPAVLVTSGLAATLLVFIFVVPKFASILSNPKADIPAFSLMILQSGLWLSLHREVAAIVVGALIAAGAVAAQQDRFRLAAWDALSNLPGTRDWIAHAELARWGALFAVLLANSVSLLDALGLARNALRGTGLRQKCEMMIADVRGGKGLAESMKQHAFADSTSINLVSVGERSGALPKTVMALASMHRSDSQQALKRFLVLLEPITILLISVVLGSIMISVMLAVTSLTSVI